jgi:hypothetical protein
MEQLPEDLAQFPVECAEIAQMLSLPPSIRIRRLPHPRTPLERTRKR